MKKIRFSLLVAVLLAVFAALMLSSCGEEEPEHTFPVYTVTAEQTDDCTLTVNKTSAESFEEIVVTVTLHNKDKKVAGVMYGGKYASKNSDGTFRFPMPSGDVTVSAVLEDYRQQLASDDTSRPFMAFPSSNITTLVPNSGEFSMRIATNGSYMTILNSEVTSSDQNVIPDDAFSVRTNFASMSNLITSADVEVDTSKISKGTTWVTVSFANGNVSSQKGTIVVRLTVSDTVAVDVWTETLTFDVDALTGVFAKFTVAVYNADYRPGMPQELEYQEFADLQAENGKITVVIRYVGGQTFRLGLFGYTDDASSFTELTTLDSVGEGSSAAGFNQYKDGVLSFTRDGAALTIRVQGK